MALRDQVTNWSNFISTTMVLVATKLDMIVHHVDGPLPIKSQEFFIMWFCVIMLQFKTNCNTTTNVSMATKLVRVVTYLEWLPPIKLLKLLATWSWKMIWQTKIIISQLLQCLWPPYLPGWRLSFRGLLSYIFTYRLIRWSCKITRKFENFLS